MTPACRDLAPLHAARPLGVLDEDEVRMLDAHLAVCERCPELVAQVDRALAAATPAEEEAPPGAWEGVAARIRKDVTRRQAVDEVAESVSIACSYCHGRMERSETVFCAACLAPHHDDCFLEHGRCSAPGCDEVEVVRPGRPQGATSEPPSASRLTVLAGFARWGLLLAGVAALAWVAQDVRQGLESIDRVLQDERHVSAPGRPRVPWAADRDLRPADWRSRLPRGVPPGEAYFAAQERTADGWLRYDDDTEEERRSIAGSGHAVLFRAPGGGELVSVALKGARYGPTRSEKTARVTVLDLEFEPIVGFEIPFGVFRRGGELSWTELDLSVHGAPGVEDGGYVRVPEQFFVCVDFNPTARDGVYVGIDTSSRGHSFLAVAEEHVEDYDPGEWMIRVRVR